MNCLKNYVGIRTPGAPPLIPKSGTFINMLAGITTDMLDKIAEKEQKTHVQVWSEIQDVAGNKLYADAIAGLMKRFQVKTIHEQIGIYPDADPGVETLAAAPNSNRGLRLNFRRLHPTFEAITIDRVFVVVPADFSSHVYIRNQRDVLLWETPENINLVAGVVNEIQVDETFIDDQIIIEVSFTNGDSFKTVLSQASRSCFCDAVSACERNSRPTIGGMIHDTAGIFTDSEFTHGVGFTGFLVCDYAALICRNRRLFLSAWLNLLGNQITIELLASGKVNQHTTVDREQYVELRDHYQVEYEKQLATIIEGIRVDQSCCLECKSPVKRVPWLP